MLETAEEILAKALPLMEEGGTHKQWSFVLGAHHLVRSAIDPRPVDSLDE